MLSYEAALRQVIKTIVPLPAQRKNLVDAAGQFLNETVTARWDMPRWDNSAMDGFAMAECSLTTGVPLEIVGSSYAGHPYPGHLEAGAAIRITTGAPLPAGADTVVPLEECHEENGRLMIQQQVKKGQHVRYQGEEFRADEELLAPGTPLHSGAIGLLAAAGVKQVKVTVRPRVAIFSTGDELVELGQQPGPGQIVNSNLQYLVARVRECDCKPVPLGIGEDQDADLTRLIEQARQCDLIVSTGGVSVGEKDLVQQTLGQLGFVRKFWKVSIKPGKPVLFGTLQNKPFFGLPGNPAATAATFELFVRPALRKLSGCSDPLTPLFRVRLAEEIETSGSRQLFLWGQLRNLAGQMNFVPSLHQGSGQNRGLQNAQALLPVPAGKTVLKKGTIVAIMLL